ncbi:hypothetical protein H6763_00600 [Candidatus Nomurabacteria bacterium]|nr:hypothetical protein [Candidatus Nomurabacteria bacterium]MCB9803313.1 hypothetical protein [Candidatus Nomurabacteria bacterium]
MKNIERQKQIENVNDYRNESRKRMLRRLIQQLPKYLGSLMIIIALYLVSTRSSIFQLKEVRIEYVGDPVSQYMDIETIDRDLEQRYMSQNYFLIDPVTIRDQASMVSTFIDQVIVTKIFPDAIELRILLREPYLRVEHQESCYLIDSNNEVLIAERSVVPTDSDGENNSGVADNASIANNSGIGNNAESTNNQQSVVDSDNAENPENPENEDLTKESLGKVNALTGVVDDPCVIMRTLTGVIPVSVTDPSIQNIFNSNKFIYFDQIYVLYGILDDQGYEINSINVMGDGSIIQLTGGVSVVVDLDDDFDIQAKRLVLVLAQMDIDRPDFKQVDVRYKRPVLHK